MAESNNLLRAIRRRTAHVREESVGLFVAGHARCLGVEPAAILADVRRNGRSDFLVPKPVVFERFVVGERIGSGGYGVVHRGLDLFAGRQVAVKFLRADEERTASGVRESAALRALRLEGVPEIFEDGLEGEHFVIVTRYVQGTPFPGPLSHRGEILDRAEALLKILEQIHGHGLVHGDLKPANVLVDILGAVSVLDLGLAALHGSTSASAAGTPRYMAPELARGGPGSAASDLYAVGVMVAGAHRQQRTRDSSLPTQHNLEPDPASSAHPNDALSAWTRCLMAPDVADRPATVAEAARALPGFRGGVGLRPAIYESRLSLEKALDCPHRVLPLRTDMLELIEAETAWERTSTRDLLEGWIRSGAAFADSTGLRIELTGYRAIRAPEHTLQLLGLTTGMSLLSLGDRQLESGATASALPTYASAFRAAVQGDDPALARECSLRVVHAALRAEDGPSLDKLAFILGTVPTKTMEYASAQRLAVAARWALQRRAREAVELALPCIHDEAEFGIASSIVGHAAQSLPPDEHAALIDTLLARLTSCTSAAARASIFGTQGWLAYRQRKFEEAGILHTQAMELHPFRVGQISASIDRAQAMLDGHKLGSARQAAEEAYRLAVELRHATHAVRALWTWRSASYRCGSSLAPEPALAREAARLGSPFFAALLGIGEAAIAWRQGDEATGQEAASLAENILRGSGATDAYVLAASLLAALGGTPASAPAGDWPSRCSQPGVALQAAALLGCVGVATGAEVVGAAFASVAHEPRGTIREVLSVEECEAMLQKHP